MPTPLPINNDNFLKEFSRALRRLVALETISGLLDTMKRSDVNDNLLSDQTDLIETVFIVRF